MQPLVSKVIGIAASALVVLNPKYAAANTRETVAPAMEEESAADVVKEIEALCAEVGYVYRVDPVTAPEPVQQAGPACPVCPEVDSAKQRGGAGGRETARSTGVSGPAAFAGIVLSSLASYQFASFRTRQREVWIRMPLASVHPAATNNSALYV